MKVRRIVLCVLVVGALCAVGWAAGEKKNVVSGLDVEFYAKIKADASWSDSRVTPGSYVLRVDPEKGYLGGSSPTITQNNAHCIIALIHSRPKTGFRETG